jgi:hypothetical protein
LGSLLEYEGFDYGLDRKPEDFASSRLWLGQLEVIETSTMGIPK